MFPLVVKLEISKILLNSKSVFSNFRHAQTYHAVSLLTLQYFAFSSPRRFLIRDLISQSIMALMHIEEEKILPKNANTLPFSSCWPTKWKKFPSRKKKFVYEEFFFLNVVLGHACYSADGISQEQILWNQRVEFFMSALHMRNPTPTSILPRSYNLFNFCLFGCLLSVHLSAQARYQNAV